MSNWRRRYLRGPVLLFATLSGACDSLVGLSKGEQAARIVFLDQSTAIAAPDTVARGTAFTVQFSSYESRCTDIPGRAEAQVSGDSVLIRAFVTTAHPCRGDALLILTHTVQVRVDRAGLVSLSVFGRKENWKGTGDTVLTRPLVVR